MTKLTARDDVDQYSLPIPDSVSILNIENSIIRFPTGYSMDIGSLCYLTRQKGPRIKMRGRAVDINSYSLVRAKEIRALLDLINLHYTSGAQRPRTLANYYRDYDKFVNWCDENNFSEVHSNLECARSAISKYTAHLRQAIAMQKIHINHGAALQNAALFVLKDYYGIYDIARGVNLLRQKDSARNAVLVPDEDKVGKVLAMSTCIFDGFYELFVNVAHYPFALKVPAYLELPENTIWVFPHNKWAFVSVENEIRRDNTGKSDKTNKLFDYKNGRLLNSQEGAKYFKCQNAANKAAKVAKKLLDEGNSDPYNHHRINRALMAVQAFLVLMIAATGMNYSQAITLRWNKDFEAQLEKPEVESQGLRTIKYRANGKEVSFTIRVRYIAYLRKYLVLRERLLMGKSFDYLFVQYGYPQYSADTPQIPNEATEQLYYVSLKRLSEKIPRVTPQQLRSAKQDHVIRNFDPVTAASHMQHSLSTALKKYSNGSVILAQQEMGEFLNEFDKLVVNKGERLAGEKTRSLGSCTSENHPLAIIKEPPAIPDCRQQEGCLFCDKYRAHADEIDLRKLISAHYCMRQTSHLVETAEDHDAVYGSILRRIDAIINQIGMINTTMANLVIKIKTDVDIHGNLDPYWASKLELLMTLSEL